MGSRTDTVIVVVSHVLCVAGLIDDCCRESCVVYSTTDTVIVVGSHVLCVARPIH